jgi:hypothetical protein
VPGLQAQQEQASPCECECVRESVWGWVKVYGLGFRVRVLD